jgi:excinuclease ABC subunit C
VQQAVADTVRVAGSTVCTRLDGSVEAMQNPAVAYRPDPGTVPTEPGCYLWRDGNGRVVYVGKAKNLRSRLANYFGAWSGVHQRTRGMLEVARSVEWIVCANEVEALHLEYNLIKEHRPRYNVRYTDDKSYPYLAITVQEEVPRAMVRRNPRKDGTRYFGPYAHAYAIRETLDALLRVFPVRTCSQGVFDRCARTGRPCLLYHIGRCAAPCVGHVTPGQHRRLVEDLIGFLEGDVDTTLTGLAEQMHAEAEKHNFEAAARLRDQIQAVQRALEKQMMVSSRADDFDAVHLHEDELEAVFQAFFVRRGRVVGRKGWTVDKVEDLSTSALLGRFLLELGMERGRDLPREVLVPETPEDREALEELLADVRGGTFSIRIPQRGERRRLLEAVRENALESFHQHRLRRASDFNARSQALQQLQEALDLAEPPLRIECYDISTLQGTDSVASMVVMEDGLSRKSEYRRFRIRGVVGQDDFAMLHEVITRRFRRLLEEQRRPASQRAAGQHSAGAGGPKKFAYPPQLVIVDGGKGQLNAARKALDDLGIAGVEICSLAKRLEEVFRPDRPDPVVLPRSSEALFLLQRIRDEAHRFAITYHRSLRGKRMTESALDQIPGVGPARRRALLDRFGSLKELREAGVDDLARVDGISDTLARAIYDHLHRPHEGAR